MKLTEEQFEALEDWVRAVAAREAAGDICERECARIAEGGTRIRFRLSVGLPEYKQPEE